jgi:dipeptidyl-peptidase-4
MTWRAPQESFPRRYARTQRFTLGAPRNVRVADDGNRVAFCRAPAGDDPVNQLWVFDVAGNAERLIFDPRTLGEDQTDQTVAEQARRERAREAAGGIVAYDADPALLLATFALGGTIHRADLGSGQVQKLETAAAAHDPRISPDGASVAYVAGPELRVTSLAGGDAAVASEDQSGISWGSAEFVAAEEMGRTRGHWWSPDSAHLLATRVDINPVSQWWIADPASPEAKPRQVRYPKAGGTNADVELAILDLRGGAIKVDWQRGEFEYLVDASWAPRTEPTVVALTRDQRTLVVLGIDPSTGECTEIHRQTDPAWVEVVPGAPLWVGEQLLTVADIGSARTLLLDGVAVTPADLQVRRIVNATPENVIIVGTTDATETHVYRIDFNGTIEMITETPGVHSAAAGADLIVVTSADLQTDGSSTIIYREGVELRSLTSNADSSGLEPSVQFIRAGATNINTAVLYPTDWAGDEPLPVLLDPYGGPHVLRVQKARAAFLTSQWFADQGFAVVVADGRGTPARGPEWERAVLGDLAQPPLDDQLIALEAAAAAHPHLDLSRVGIRGWSFGGYLAALAVLRRPDVFHAAVAGAPVTDWRLYDTFYTERYLGDPATDPDNYERSSILDEAGELSRPLLLIHGFADDNVVVAHTLKFSQALLETGRAHTVLPLSGVTHMTPQEAVAENLLLLQVDFLRKSLDLS